MVQLLNKYDVSIIHSMGYDASLQKITKIMEKILRIF